MKRPAEALHELLPAKLEHCAEANVGHIGNFESDLGRVAQPGQIAGCNAEHFALLELPELCKSARIIARL